MCLTPKFDHTCSIASLSSPVSLDITQHKCDWNSLPSCDYVSDKPNELDRSSLQIMQQNIRGLVNKQDDLNKIMHDYDIDAALLCETWLNDFSTQRVHLNGYQLINKNRKDRKGGGVCILVKDCLKLRIIPPSGANMEHIIVEVKTHTGSVFLSSCYRPPNSNNLEFLKDYESLLSYLSSLAKKADSYIILGLDHNLDLIKSDTHKPTNEFLEMNYAHGLIPSINKPTRITNTSATLIDNIFISQGIESQSKSSIMIDDLSDHLPCILTCAGLKKAVTNNLMSKRKLTKKAIDQMRTDLEKVNWHKKLQPLNTEECFQTFHNDITSILDKHAPEKLVNTNTKRAHLPWITKGIKKSITNQKMLYKKSLESPCSINTLKYKEYRNSLNRIKRASKVLYHTNECDKN